MAVLSETIVTFLDMENVRLSAVVGLSPAAQTNATVYGPGARNPALNW